MSIILVIIIGLFLSEKSPLAVISLSGAVIVGLCGFVEHRTVFAPFASTSMLLMISMMVLRTLCDLWDLRYSTRDLLKGSAIFSTSSPAAVNAA